MKKVPTMFQRDWNGDRSKVLDIQNEECLWVFKGEGVATRKLDGMCAMVENGILYKRREVKKNKVAPLGFIEINIDEKTGKRIGWLKVDFKEKEDKYFKEAFHNTEIIDGTCELVGKKSQGGIEGYEKHQLVFHNSKILVFKDQPPRDFVGLKAWLTGKDIEGIVFHHQDLRMCKIKLKDFGIKRIKINV